MDDISEMERLREENNSLRSEIDRLKAWNKAFYGRVHYYFNQLEEWKAAPRYGDQRRKLTAWLDSTGQARASMQINAREVQLLGSKKDNNNQNQQ